MLVQFDQESARALKRHREHVLVLHRAAAVPPVWEQEADRAAALEELRECRGEGHDGKRKAGCCFRLNAAVARQGSSGAALRVALCLLARARQEKQPGDEQHEREQHGDEHPTSGNPDGAPAKARHEEQREQRRPEYRLQ